MMAKSLTVLLRRDEVTLFKKEVILCLILNIDQMAEMIPETIF